MIFNLSDHIYDTEKIMAYCTKLSLKYNNCLVHPKSGQVKIGWEIISNWNKHSMLGVNNVAHIFPIYVNLLRKS